MLDDLALARLCQQVYQPPWLSIGDVRYTIHRDLDPRPVIVFQGTIDAAETLTDLHAWPMRSCLGWYGHAGIVGRAEAVLPALLASVSGPAIITGHSLGAGLALAVSALWPWPDNLVVALEPPRVGFFGFARALRRHTVRIYRHGNDPVPQVPIWLPWWPYHHPRWLIRFGQPTPDPIDSHAITGIIQDLEAEAQVSNSAPPFKIAS
jgi:hypothetical protein